MDPLAEIFALTKSRPRAWLREPKVQRIPGRHLVRGVSAGEPSQEEREFAELDGDRLVPLYDQAALDAAVAAERERWRDLATDIRAIEATGMLPDGDIVPMPVVLWAEEWRAKIDGHAPQDQPKEPT